MARQLRPAERQGNRRLGGNCAVCTEPVKHRHKVRTHPVLADGIKWMCDRCFDVWSAGNLVVERQHQ